jgi:hypothetical protein
VCHIITCPFVLICYISAIKKGVKP